VCVRLVRERVINYMRRSPDVAVVVPLFVIVTVGVGVVVVVTMVVRRVLPVRAVTIRVVRVHKSYSYKLMSR
jgi:hypothetical protein